MKNRWNLLLGFVLTGLMLSGCSPEYILPEEENTNGRALAGSESNPHPALDTICQSMDTIWLMGEDGSTEINKCFGPNGQITCPPGQMRWGFVLIREGYSEGIGYVDCEFALSPGWYGQATNWKAGLASTFEFDGNGIPLVQGDWSTLSTNPLENRWVLRFPTHSMPSTSFDILMRVQGVRLNLSGALTEGSNTNLWSRNPHCMDPASPNFSAVSPLVIHFTSMLCDESAEMLPTCTTLKLGAPALGNCMTIAANTTGLGGGLTYQWSTGATTPSISVCPTATTFYTVTISSNGYEVRTNEITVNVSNVACGNSNGNNGIHKVRVCHLPPGNPENQQDICIDWSGVPAHVAEYRPAGSTQGHDSGCRLGPCSYNPCL